jgi:KilA-N domain.
MILVKKQVKETIRAKGIDIMIYTNNFQDEFISLIDIAKYSDFEYASDVINNWLRIRNTVEYLGIWEKLYNDNFNSLEFEGIEKNREEFVCVESEEMDNDYKCNWNDD